MDNGGMAAPAKRSPTKTSERESQTDRTVRAIRAGILTGTHGLGERLPEAELASRYGVSYSVVREALHILQGEGVVVSKPYCGRSVFSMDQQQAVDLTVMRASLEALAAFQAAQKMTPEGAQRIWTAAANLRSVRPATYAQWVDSEMTFHRAVWTAAANPWLERQLNNFVVVTFAVSTIQSFREGFDFDALLDGIAECETPDEARGHQLVTQAILAGDALRAKEAMVRHVTAEIVDRELVAQVFGYR